LSHAQSNRGVGKRAQSVLSEPPCKSSLLCVPDWPPKTLDTCFSSLGYALLKKNR
jgi:hypothetical protein